jgi:hypothetical protein
MTAAARIEDLVAINLRYDAGSGHLNVRALAQLVAKLLFAGGRAVSQSPEELGKAAGRVLQVPRIGKAATSAALEYLRENRLVRESGSRWLLSDFGYKEIESDVSRASTRLQGVLARHFPASLDRPTLENWFRDSCVAFYGMYGTQWAAALGRQAPRKPVTRGAIKSLLEEATRSAGWGAHAQVLLEGFHGFLSSQHTEDVDHQWSLGQALLASRLVAANIGPDPITAADFRNSILLLDTNALIVAALEAHRLAVPLAALGTALASLGVRLGLIEETREEYTRAVDGARNTVLALIDRISLKVLRGSRDPFLQTALERYCTSASDFARFFDELLDPPKTLPDGSHIELFSDDTVRKSALEGSMDEKLKQSIVSIWRERRGRRKGPRAVEHDAALTAVAEGLRTGGHQCVVLTLDLTMHEHSLGRAGPHGPPVWVSIDALIQVLAVDGSGPDVDPAKFAPLMSSIIRHQCEPSMNTYTAEDLGIILDVEQRCAALPEEDIRSIATMVSRERLAGKPRYDPELQLKVKRAFQRGHLDENVVLQKQVETKTIELQNQDKRITREARKREVARTAFIASRTRELRKEASRLLRRRLFFAAIGLPLLGILGLLAAREIVPTGFGPDFFGMIAITLGPAYTVIGWIWAKVLPQWRSSMASAESVAKEEIELAETAAEGDIS